MEAAVEYETEEVVEVPVEEVEESRFHLLKNLHWNITFNFRNRKKTDPLKNSLHLDGSSLIHQRHLDFLPDLRRRILIWALVRQAIVVVATPDSKCHIQFGEITKRIVQVLIRLMRRDVQPRAQLKELVPDLV